LSLVWLDTRASCADEAGRRGRAAPHGAEHLRCGGSREAAQRQWGRSSGASVREQLGGVEQHVAAPRARGGAVKGGFDRCGGGRLRQAGGTKRGCDRRDLGKKRERGERWLGDGGDATLASQKGQNRST